MQVKAFFCISFHLIACSFLGVEGRTGIKTSRFSASCSCGGRAYSLRSTQKHSKAVSAWGGYLP